MLRVLRVVLRVLREPKGLKVELVHKGLKVVW